MACGLVYLEYLLKKGCFGSSEIRLLDIGSQNLLGASTLRLASFLEQIDYSQVDATEKIGALADRATIGAGIETTYLSEIFENTRVAYESLDVAAGKKTIIFDLNTETLPKRLHSAFNLVLNFGTTEHVFNQYNAFKVIHEAAAPGAFIFHQVPALGYVDTCYFLYTARFFRELATANQYELVDLWFTGPQGQSNIAQEFGETFDKERLSVSDSVEANWNSSPVPNAVINVLFRKVSNDIFKIGLELSTSHAGVSLELTDSYSQSAQEKTRIGLNETGPKSGKWRSVLGPIGRVVRRAASRFARAQVPSRTRGECAEEASEKSARNDSFASALATAQAGFYSPEDYSVFMRSLDKITLPGWWADKHKAVVTLLPSYRRAVEYALLNQLQGDFAEFGSYSGLTTIHLAYLLKKLNSAKTLWAFDSFEGLPAITKEPDLDSPEVNDTKVWAEGVMAMPCAYEKVVQEALEEYLPSRQVRVVKGYFSESINRELLPKCVSLLHLDCDLYSSTHEVLLYMLNNKALVDGAVILFDDYNCGRANPRHGQRCAVQEVLDRFPEMTLELWFSYGWHGQAFLYHRSDNS